MKKNKVQEYAILWLNSQNQKHGDIADELGIGIEKVEAVVRVHSEPKQSVNAGTTSNKKSSKSKSLMITQTSEKKNKSVAIMTPEASALNDELKKKFRGKSEDSKGFIFRPND